MQGRVVYAQCNVILRFIWYVEEGEWFLCWFQRNFSFRVILSVSSNQFHMGATVAQWCKTAKSTKRLELETPWSNNITVEAMFVTCLVLFSRLSALISKEAKYSKVGIRNLSPHLRNSAILRTTKSIVELRTKKSCGTVIADLQNLTSAIPQLSAVSCQSATFLSLFLSSGWI